ncbi:MAG: hypothetical protein AAB295_12215, partial [Chloroflexota bacterium]
MIVDNSRAVIPQIFTADNLAASVSNQTVSGAAEPGANVTVNLNGSNVGTVGANLVTGLWSTTVSLTPGDNVIFATAADSVANVSVKSGREVSLKGVGQTGATIGTEQGGDTVLPRVSKVALIVRGANADSQTIVIVRGGALEDTITIDTGTLIGRRVVGTVDFARLDTVAVKNGDSNANNMSVEVRAEDQYVFFRLDNTAPKPTVTTIKEELSGQLTPLNGKSTLSTAENIMVFGRSTPAGANGGLSRVDVVVKAQNGTLTTVKTTDAGGALDSAVSGGAYDTWQVRIPNSVLIGGGEGNYTIFAVTQDLAGNRDTAAPDSSKDVFVLDQTPPGTAARLLRLFP